MLAKTLDFAVHGSRMQWYEIARSLVQVLTEGLLTVQYQRVFLGTSLS